MVVKVNASDIAGYALAGAARKVEAGWRKRNKLDKQLKPIKRWSRKSRKKISSKQGENGQKEIC